MDRAALEALGREELVVEARRFGVKRPEVMTRVELVDEVLRLATPNPVERKQVRGWLGIARDLLASAIERGLNLPDAAAMIRGDVRFVPLQPEQPPVATVTLAEIYGAQGHLERALRMLDEVLERESDHSVARRLRARLVAERDAKRAKQTPPPADPPQSSAEQQPPREAPAAAEEPVPAASGSAEEPAVTAEPPEPATLPPSRREDEEEPEHATLMPARPEANELGEQEEPEHVTLMPARPEANELGEEGEPEHATLMPARPEVNELGEEEEPEHATLMPVRPDVAVLGYDELEQETLIPAPSARAPDDAIGRDVPEPGYAVGTNVVVSTTGVDVSSAEQVVEPSVEEASDAAVVFARTSAGSAAVYFELGRLAATGDVLVLRVVEHRPRVDGVERVERDLLVSERHGIATVADLETGSVVRAAIGRKWDGHFEAAAVGAEVRVAADGVAIAWAPRSNVDYGAVVGRSGLAARAVL